MAPGSRAAASPVTWLLALLFTVAAGAAIPRLPWLWDKQTLWLRGELGATAFWQTYAATRTLFHEEVPPAAPADLRVALLGNSRLWLPARPGLIEAELRRQAPGRDPRVLNAAFFGARVGDMEAVSRHLERARPTLVVIGLSGSDLVPSTWGPLLNPTGQMFELGWRDPALPPDGVGARVDRWVKDLWPLYRWRLYARERLKDALWPSPNAETIPDSFPSSRAYFDYLYGTRGAAVEAAYQAWRGEPSLERYLAFVTMNAPIDRLAEDLQAPETLTPASPGPQLLDRMLARLADEHIPVMIVLMPENPMLAQDTTARFHRPGFDAQAARVIETIAARRGARVVDGRGWMPAEAFADFNHVIPGVSGFHVRLAEEVLRAQNS